MTSTHGLKVCVPLQWPTDLSSSAAPPQTAQSLVQSSRLVWRLWQRRCRCCNVSREVENKPAVPWHPDLAPDPHTEAGVGDSPGHHRAVTHSHCPPITHSHCPPVTHSHCPPITLTLSTCHTLTLSTYHTSPLSTYHTNTHPNVPGPLAPLPHSETLGSHPPGQHQTLQGGAG